MRDLVRVLKNRWVADGIALAPGASLSQIEEFEDGHGIQLPADMRHFFRTMNGMGSRGPMDSNLYSFWDLGSVVGVLDELGLAAAPDFLPDARSYFVFADYAIGVNFFCIDLTTANHAVVCISAERPITSDSVTHVSETFTSAIELYLAGADPFI